MAKIELIFVIVIGIMFLAVLIIVSSRRTEHKGTRCLNCDYSGYPNEFVNGKCPKCGSHDTY